MERLCRSIDGDLDEPAGSINLSTAVIEKTDMSTPDFAVLRTAATNGKRKG